MVILQTQGVEIKVRTAFSNEQSSPAHSRYFFLYEITILNKNEFAIQLLRRKWFICDSTGEQHEVEGDGVIGMQPVLTPNEKFTYNSGCPLQSEMGKMSGFYTMLRLFDSKEFIARVPEFHFIVPGKLN